MQLRWQQPVGEEEEGHSVFSHAIFGNNFSITNSVSKKIICWLNSKKKTLIIKTHVEHGNFLAFYINLCYSKQKPLCGAKPRTVRTMIRDPDQSNNLSVYDCVLPRNSLSPRLVPWPALPPPSCMHEYTVQTVLKSKS